LKRHFIKIKIFEKNNTFLHIYFLLETLARTLLVKIPEKLILKIWKIIEKYISKKAHWKIFFKKISKNTTHILKKIHQKS